MFKGLDTLAELVQKLRATNSNKEKQGILKSYVGHEDEEFIKKALEYTYNPYKRYGVSEQVYETTPLVKNTIFTDMFEMFDKLAESNINDLLRLSVKSYIKNQIPSEHQELVESMLFKDLKVGANVKTFNKIWKGYIPQFDVQLAESFDKKTVPKNVPFYITTKIDGCFYGGTHITMHDGNFKCIKDVKVGDYVLSFDENTKKLSSQKVLNVFNNGMKEKDRWVKLIISKNGDGLKMKKTISTTKNHKFFTPKGWKQASDFAVGDSFYTYNYVPSQTQIDVLVGLCFGDGSIIFDSKEGKNARFFYTQKQNSDSVKAISTLFQEYLGSPRKFESGYGTIMECFRIKTIHDLPPVFYNRENVLKTSFLPTDETLKNLTPLALAVWYMDDGHKHQSQEDGDNVPNVQTRATLSTYRYPLNSLLKLKSYLETQYGITGSLHKYKNTNDGKDFGYQFVFDANGTDALFKTIAPYILPDKKYKISQKYRDIEFIDWTNDKGKVELVERKIIGVDYENPFTKNNGKKHQQAYDLEIENTHTYFANGCAVHNCRILGIPNKDGYYNFYTRKGESYEGLDHLQKECQLIGMGTYVLDGELIARNDDNLASGDLYKVTTKIARKKGQTKDKEKLQFHCFDIVDATEFRDGESFATYNQRRNLLDSMFEEHKSDLHNLVKVEVLYEGTDQSVIPTFTAKLEEQGLEGAMINVANARYKCKRHDGILKVKSFKDADVWVKSVYEGTGRNKGRLGGVVVQYLHNGELQECECGSGFTDKHRIDFWENPELILGRVIEIQYFEATTNEKGGVGLRFPTFKNRFRDDKTFEEITDVSK